MSSLDMLLAACASIAHAVPTMDTLRGSFTTRAQTISACCLLSGDSEERGRESCIIATSIGWEYSMLAPMNWPKL